MLILDYDVGQAALVLLSPSQSLRERIADELNEGEDASSLAKLD